MPGITGIIGRDSIQRGPDVLQVMVKSMLHEKFYVSGTYANDHVGLRCGWICHKDSFSDCLPIWNEKEDICLIFSGEHYGDQSDIDDLKAKGHECNSKNASYLVHLYEDMGIRFIEKLNGWFCGVLVDLREGKVVLFNDRYGLNRIYCHENENGFYFSSEAKSLLKVLPSLRKFDASSLGEYFSLGCTLGNRTLFSGVSLVPAGSIWTFSPNRKVSKNIHFNPEIWENQPKLSKALYYDKLKETFANIIPKYLNGRQRVAMSLTGGLDTRMIMAWAQCPPRELPCYTFGGMYRDCTDVRIAREVSRICQQQHTNIKVDNKFFFEFPALAEAAVYYTDGTVDVSGAVGLYNHRLAREIAPVRVTGNYGDQALRSDRAFNPNFLYEGILDPEFARLAREGLRSSDNIAQESGLTFFVSKQMPWSYYPRFALESSQLTVRSPYLDNDLISLVYQAPQDLLLSKELSFRLIADGNPDLSRVPTDRGLLYRPIPIVTKFRHLYEEFTFKAEYAYDHGMPQWLAQIDHAFAPLHLERLFLGRHKYYHFRVWYRNELSSYVKEIILDPRTRSRPYLQGSVLEKMVMSHINGHRNYTHEIHKILSTELIERHLIEME
jgi:asparagine synthase (glutamine-hydrolysing)